VRRRDVVELFTGFRQRHVQAFFAEAPALEEKLKRQRRLAGSRLAFNQVHAIAR
jgi:hypothetical protein